MFNLELKDAISAITGIITITGSFFAVKYGQRESHRLLVAVHRRLDEITRDVTTMKIEHARLDERVKSLRQTGRFRLSSPAETKMFKDDAED